MCEVETMNISVAMAVYNGEKYLREQLDSILKQLDSADEVVISYNESDDHTLDIIKEYHARYENVFITECREKGVIPNFENALKHCKKDYIFLSDQDDVWMDDKVEKVMKRFREKNVLLVMHNCSYTDEDLNDTGMDLFTDRKANRKFVNNLVKNTYQGSCMAFHSVLIPLILPIPRDVAMHDQWIGLIAEQAGHLSFLDENLIKYRRHSATATKGHISLKAKISYMAVTFTLVKVRLQEMRMYYWYLQGVYAPEKRMINEDDEDEKPVSVEKPAVKEENFDEEDNGETMMYMVNDFKKAEKNSDQLD